MRERDSHFFSARTRARVCVSVSILLLLLYKYILLREFKIKSPENNMCVTNRVQFALWALEGVDRWGGWVVVGGRQQ